MKKRIAVIGSGFSSLAASCYLAQAGYEVALFEKNPTIGGRASQLKASGFTFDMGPTWYWMPDVFERFFADFGKISSEYYQLHKLNPAYSVVFGPNDRITVEDSLDKIAQAFEEVEPGSSKQLKKFIGQAQDNYRVAIEDLVYRPGLSPLELVTVAAAKRISRFFRSVSADVRRQFKNPKLVSLLEFPVLFLGAKPSKTPAFYSFMNYADFGLGTFHPENGMYSVIEGLAQLARELGVTINTDSPVSEIKITNGRATAITINETDHEFDAILSGADYHHTETLLPAEYRQYSERYWNKRVFAPSALLFYVGFDKKVEHVDHHTLFFDVPFDAHAASIYDTPSWPERPLFYASFPSKTDKNSAPVGKEAAIFLIPLAPGLTDIPELREEFFGKIMSRLENLTNQELKNSVIFKESFCINDFVSAYNSYKGNAYGLANTLRQTAFLRPKLRSKKVKGLYFTGQLTVPGPGVPPALISGKLAAGLVQKEIAK